MELGEHATRLFRALDQADGGRGEHLQRVVLRKLAKPFPDLLPFAELRELPGLVSGQTVDV